MIFKMTAKAVLLVGLVLIGLASAPSFASDESIEFFPPKNLEAGIGFLYFDAGRIGNQSVYAVPVQSDKLIAAVEKQTLAITELKDSLQKTSGAIQCFKEDPQVQAVTCVNTVTGTVCAYSHADCTNNGRCWGCLVSPNSFNARGTVGFFNSPQ